jgi:hypothetical protein
MGNDTLCPICARTLSYDYSPLPVTTPASTISSDEVSNSSSSKPESLHLILSSSAKKKGKQK